MLGKSMIDLLESIRAEIAMYQSFATFEEYAAFAHVPLTDDFRKIYTMGKNGCMYWSTANLPWVLINRGFVEIVKKEFSPGLSIVKLGGHQNDI